VVPVSICILAPAVAHGQAGRAHALALLALGRVVAALATLATVVLVSERVLQGRWGIVCVRWVGLARCQGLQASFAVMTAEGSQQPFIMASPQC
jgi:hypothetical protein